MSVHEIFFCLFISIGKSVVTPPLVMQRFSTISILILLSFAQCNSKQQEKWKKYYMFCLVMYDILSYTASIQLTYFLFFFFSFFYKIHLHSLSRTNFEFVQSPQESVSVVLNFLPKTSEVKGKNNLFFFFQPKCCDLSLNILWQSWAI